MRSTLALAPCPRSCSSSLLTPHLRRDISLVDGTYILYYSTSTFGTQKSAIWLATSSTGLPGSWTDKGKVLESKEGDPYNAIDAQCVLFTLFSSPFRAEAAS